MKKSIFKAGQIMRTKHEAAVLKKFDHKVPGKKGEEVWQVKYEETHTFGTEIVKKSLLFL